MPGCMDCKYYDHKLGDFINGKFESIKKCQLDKDSEMINWWLENGNKKTGDIFDDMNCHDYPDSTKILNDLNRSATKLLKHLKLSNRRKSFTRIISKL